MEQQQADALGLLAETALRHGIDPGAPGERYQVVLHVDAQVLADAEAPGQSVLEGGARVPAGTSQRLACDVSRVVMQHDADGRITEVEAPRRCRISRCSVAGTIGRSTRRAIRSNDMRTVSSSSGSRMGDHCLKSPRRPQCRPRPAKHCDLATQRSTFTRARRCRAGWENVSTWAMPSACCIRLPLAHDQPANDGRPASANHPRRLDLCAARCYKLARRDRQRSGGLA